MEDNILLPTTLSEAGISELTIADYFAAKALQALISDPEASGTHEHFAKWAYAYADAMIAERNNRQSTSATPATEPTIQKVTQ